MFRLKPTIIAMLLSFLVVSSGDAFAAQKKISMQQALAHYLKLLPVDVSRQIALDGMPKEMRPEAEQILTVSFFEEMVKKALEKRFTPDEIIAMANFYGGPVGKRISAKMPDFMLDVSSAIQKKMNSVGTSNNHPGFTPIPGR